MIQNIEPDYEHIKWDFSSFQPEGRVDPMSRVFPRMTKCTFEKFGPSGTIQRHDAQVLYYKLHESISITKSLTLSEPTVLQNA